MKLTGLELCRKVADIDGWSGVDTITNIGALSAVVDGKGGVIGKALLLDLMFKYEISACHETYTVSKRVMAGEVVRVDFCTATRPRAILECIVLANQ
jgi:hypothetical protein